MTIVFLSPTFTHDTDTAASFELGTLRWVLVAIKSHLLASTKMLLVVIMILTVLLHIVDAAGTTAARLLRCQNAGWSVDEMAIAAVFFCNSFSLFGTDICSAAEDKFFVCGPGWFDAFCNLRVVGVCLDVGDLIPVCSLLNWRQLKPIVGGNGCWHRHSYGDQSTFMDFRWDKLELSALVTRSLLNFAVKRNLPTRIFPFCLCGWARISRAWLFRCQGIYKMIEIWERHIIWVFSPAQRAGHMLTRDSLLLWGLL